jgi:thiamine-monophosphate kinase
MDEFEIIAKIFAPLATAPGAFGLTDDAAAIPPRPGFDLVVTTDQIAEGTDFLPGTSAERIAKKALRVNLSDLAAKGAEPFGYLVNLTLPQADRAWLESFAKGLADEQTQARISLLGGDTGKGLLAIAVTAFGHVPSGAMVRRAGARPGMAVYVTGTIGDSGGGLAVLQGKGGALAAADRDVLIDAYHLPKPPLRFGSRLAQWANAAIDISDGLIADLEHLARASGVKIAADAALVPLSPSLRALWGEAAIVKAATAGDDYQIAFCADPSRDAEIMAAAHNSGTAVTRIGTVEPGAGVTLMLKGRELAIPGSGYKHF